MFQSTYHLPRTAFSARDAARAGDLWRLCQEVASDASAAVGWPPSRFREHRIGFVARRMVAVHVRESHHGEPVHARTHVTGLRRDVLLMRNIDLDGPRGPVSRISQEWAFVRVNLDGAEIDVPPLRAARAPADIQAAFSSDDSTEIAHLPLWKPLIGPSFGFSFECFELWSDPFGHVNHPTYLDWCDESVSRELRRVSVDPLVLKPIAEEVLWRMPVGPRDPVEVQTRVIGIAEQGLVFEHRLLAPTGMSYAVATTIRAAVDGRDLAGPLGVTTGG